MKKEQPERRRYKRIQKHFILTYYDLTKPQERHEASQLKNISIGGICIITAKPFSPNAVLAIELKTPFIHELTRLEGVVLESHERMKDIIYETRLEFRNLSAQAKFVLNKLIHYFENEESHRHE